MNRRLSLVPLMLAALSGCDTGAPSNGNTSRPRNAVAEPALDATPPTIPADALNAAATDDAVRAFYQRAGWRGLWSAAATAALDRAIGGRIDNGLDRMAFGRVDASMSPAQRDVTRTAAALAYAAALAHGAVDPTTLHQVYTLPRADADVAAGLLQALRQNRVAHFFAGLPPQDDDYRRLSQAYVRYARAGNQPQPAGIAGTGPIHAGDRDPRMGEIVKQLAANGYLPDGGAPALGDGQAAAYTPMLVGAVKQLQADYGIKADGVIGDDTLAVVNTGPADKARALAVALERRRWLTRSPAATRIDVNTAAATLDYYRGGKLVDHRRVIVGQPGRETPPLRAPMFRLVANPTWTVPKSIPVSAATIRAKHMHRENGFLVQPAGPDNALGLVKFDLKDDQAIYLHDTSNRSLFDRSQRDLSHGCVRVQDALGFAGMIARQEGVQTKWDKARQSGDETYVVLPQSIPVRLLYQNAFVDGHGEVAFRTDPYDWNNAVAAKLGFPGGAGRKAKAKDVDLGP